MNWRSLFRRSKPREIPLNRGLTALVDEQDYDRVVAAGPWYALATDSPGRFYAMSNHPRDGVKTPYMHRAETAAARAYDVVARATWGDRARLNNP